MRINLNFTGACDLTLEYEVREGEEYREAVVAVAHDLFSRPTFLATPANTKFHVKFCGMKRDRVLVKYLRKMWEEREIIL